MEKERTASQRPAAGRYLREESRKKPRKRRRKLRPWIWIAAIAGVILLTVILLLTCFRTDKLKGTWRYDEVTAYRFDGKGNGTLVLPDKEYPFSYKLTGGKLSIDFESEAARDSTYDCSVDGNQLTLVGGEGAASGSYTMTREDG